MDEKALQIVRGYIAAHLDMTYNGDKHEWYLDAYKKFENVVVPESVVK